MSRAIGRWAPRVAVAALLVGVVSAVVALMVAAATSRHGRGTGAGSHAVTDTQSLAANVAPTPRPLRTGADPAAVAPAERYCLRVLGAQAVELCRREVGRAL